MKNKNHTQPKFLTRAQLARLTLPELEQEKKRIIAIRNQNPGEHTLQDYHADISRALHSRARLIKQKVMAFEADNCQYLLFYVSTENYHKLAERSALFYASRLAQALGRRFNLRPDTDHYHPSSIGVISVRNLEVLEPQLEALGVKLIKSRSTRELRLYKLPRALSESEIATLATAQHQLRHQLASIQHPDGQLPELYVALLELSQLTRTAVGSAKAGYPADKVRHALDDKVDYLVRAYRNFVGGRLEPSFRYEVPMPKYSIRAELTPNSPRARALLALYAWSCLLEDDAVRIEDLRLIAPERVGQILATNTRIQKLTLKAYQEQIAKENHD